MTSKNCGEQKNSRDASISFKLHLFPLSFKQSMFFFRILKRYDQLNFHFPLGYFLGNTTNSITSFLSTDHQMYKTIHITKKGFNFYVLLKTNQRVILKPLKWICFDFDPL